jgi:hypothetical protein
VFRDSVVSYLPPTVGVRVSPQFGRLAFGHGVAPVEFPGSSGGWNWRESSTPGPATVQKSASGSLGLLGRRGAEQGVVLRAHLQQRGAVGDRQELAHAGADRDGFHQAPRVGGAEAVAVLVVSAIVAGFPSG